MSESVPEIAEERRSAPVDAGAGARVVGVVGVGVGGQRADRGLPDLAVPSPPASISILISGLSIPHAFGREGTLFAVTYAIVRFLHLAVYVDASKRGNAKWSSMVGFMVTITIGMVLRDHLPGEVDRGHRRRCARPERRAAAERRPGNQPGSRENINHRRMRG
ncbi:MAG: hypothetical protein ACLPY3_23295 [Solirubrobacteraceae bacterium]